jgi:hypothetical protein
MARVQSQDLYQLRSNVVHSKSRGAEGAREAGGEKVISLNATPYYALSQFCKGRIRLSASSTMQLQLVERA